jgi:cytochrome P450
MRSGSDERTGRIDLTDPAHFAGDDVDELYAELFRRGPIHRNETGDGAFWVAVRHDSIVEAYSDPATFSSVNGIRLGASAESVGGAAGRMLIVSDPPEHSRLRRTVAGTLGPDSLRRVEPEIRRLVADLFDQTIGRGPFDVVEMIAARIPEAVIGTLLGVPEQDRRAVLELTDRAFHGSDPASRAAASTDIFVYLDELVSHRSASPGTDLLSQLLTAGLDRDDAILNGTGLLFGGSETTRHVISGAVAAFARFPAELDRLRSGSASTASAAEELLRWTSPAVYVLRTITRHTRFAGTDLEAGEQIALWNAAGNRDPDVFHDPHRLDVTRSPNPHLAFGHGRHTCVGGRLARLELNAFLAELVRRVTRVTITEPPVWNGSNFARGYQKLIATWEVR